MSPFRRSKKRIFLAVLGVVVAGLAGVVVLNWEAVSANFGRTVGEQSERARVALFRAGELMSIEARLKDEYGGSPEVSYEKLDDERVLGIAVALPDGAPPEAHARRVASFALNQTKKRDEIDVVRVAVERGADPFSFAARN